MLEVLVDSSFLRCGIFVSQGRKSITINALAMHGLVESCIPLPVFGLESDGGRHVWEAGVRWKFEDQLATLKVLEQRRCSRAGRRIVRARKGWMPEDNVGWAAYWSIDFLGPLLQVSTSLFLTRARLGLAQSAGFHIAGGAHFVAHESEQCHPIANPTSDLSVHLRSTSTLVAGGTYSKVAAPRHSYPDNYFIFNQTCQLKSNKT